MVWQNLSFAIAHSSAVLSIPMTLPVVTAVHY